MVKAFVLIMLSIQILCSISTSVNMPGKHIKSYVEQWKYKHHDDPLSMVRKINKMVQSLMKMTDQRKNKQLRSTSTNLKMTKPIYKMFRRFT